MVPLDDQTAAALGLIQQYHQITRELEAQRRRVAWLESERARLEAEIPAATFAGSKPSTRGTVPIRIGLGEAVDRVTILDIKIDVLSDRPDRQAERDRLMRERGQLIAAIADAPIEPADWRELRHFNREIWFTLADQRRLDGRQDFGPDFVELSRHVYKLNDLRAAVKARIDTAAGGAAREVKVYEHQGTKN